MKATILILILFLSSCRNNKTALVNRQIVIKKELSKINEQINDKPSVSLPTEVYKKRFDSLLLLQNRLMKENDSLETELKKY